MQNVSGITTAESRKATDLLMKCQYLDEITDGKGVVFCTGTPISNSAAELYTMMRYIQADTLREHGLYAFDAWAANFGETVSAMELAPEGTGYRMKRGLPGSTICRNSSACGSWLRMYRQPTC